MAQVYGYVIGVSQPTLLQFYNEAGTTLYYQCYTNSSGQYAMVVAIKKYKVRIAGAWTTPAPFEVKYPVQYQDFPGSKPPGPAPEVPEEVGCSLPENALLYHPDHVGEFPRKVKKDDYDILYFDGDSWNGDQRGMILVPRNGVTKPPHKDHTHGHEPIPKPKEKAPARKACGASKACGSKKEEPAAKKKAK